jgi:hypothetical protein
MNCLFISRHDALLASIFIDFPDSKRILPRDIPLTALIRCLEMRKYFLLPFGLFWDGDHNWFF